MKQTHSFAFFFGVLGGFGGVYILDRLLEIVLRKGQPPSGSRQPPGA